jgi:hypothetical protein
MKFWWLLGLVLFLIVAITFRESFTTYEDALKDVGQTAGYTSLTGGSTTSETPAPDPSCPAGFTMDSDKLTCKSTTGLPPACPSGYPISDPSPTSVKCFQTALNEGEFKIKECPTGTTRGEGGLCYGASQPSSCPSGFQLDRQQIHDGTGNIRTVGKCKATGGTTGASAGATQCPAGFVEDKRLWDGKLRCKKEVGQPKCPNGYTMSPFVKMAEGQYNGGTCTKGTDLTAPQCEGESMLNVMNDKQVCVEYAFATSTGASAGATTGTNATGGTTTQTTSGTGSGVTPSTIKKSSLLGPVFTSYGAPITPGNPESHKTNKYPQLLGGGDPAARNRESGAGAGGGGIGSMAGVDLQGSLPTMDGLGATEASKYFPFSRQPGDMELIPDPYRVSQQFSSASYSFKTEPTPFLTDFSAFLR